MANKIHKEVIQLDLVIGGNKARKELGQLESEMHDLNRERDKMIQQKKLLARSNKKNSVEYKKLTKSLQQNKRALATNALKQKALRKEIGLNGLTTKQLGQEIKTLNRLLANTTPGTAKWKQLNAQLQKAKRRMAELRGKAERTGLSLRKMADGFNRKNRMVAARGR